MKKILRFYLDQLIYCCVALPLGAITGVICAFFGIGLLKITDFRTEHYLFLLSFLGLAGLFIVWCYSRFGADASKGMSLLFEVKQNKREKTPLRLVPMIIGATWLTHLFGGSAGREGVAVQIGGTLGNFSGNLFERIRKGKLQDQKERGKANHILMIAGMAAGFGGLFRTPFAATFFALEVLKVGALEYAALLPSLIAACMASYISGLLGLGKFTNLLAVSTKLNWNVTWKLIVLGLAFGLAGLAFSWLLKKLKPLFAKWFSSALIRILVIGTAVGLISLVCLKGRYSGLGTNLISMGFDGGILPWDFVVKLLFTVITLAAGFYGGEVTPLFSIGVSLGFVLGSLLGLPTALCAALGYAAVFGSATNTLIAPILIGAEVFGMDYLPFFVIVCAVAWFCNGNQSIYALQDQSM